METIARCTLNSIPQVRPVIPVHYVLRSGADYLADAHTGRAALSPWGALNTCFREYAERLCEDLNAREDGQAWAVEVLPGTGEAMPSGEKGGGA